jgi:putative toxin-antitoxin system antitoxin component (TIGR02293 family)
MSEVEMAGAAKSKVDQASEITRVLDLLGGAATFKGRFLSPLEAHEMIIRGFPASALTSLCQNVSLFQRSEASFRALGISQRTLQRRKAEALPKTLTSEQSGRAWKLAEIVTKATQVFGSQEEAEQWLERPAIGLNQNRPIELLSTTAGTELVEQHLERIEFGVYT